MAKSAPTHGPIHRPIPMVCCACKDRLGAKEIPFDVPEDNGDGKGKTERFCPQCFVNVRALRDNRWLAAVVIRQILAIQCLNPACGVKSVDMGRRQCSQCGSRQYLELPPKGASVHAAVVGTIPRPHVFTTSRKLARTAGVRR